uniref:Putative reverse transcriptase-rnase h-integrase n=1 Tax=Moniliophthora roreri TaxID=221103 RepID=A0A0W0FTJ2_MONRR
MWDPAQPTQLEVDASGYATGGVILQQLEDGLWHPVAYRSESMAPAERNYEIYDREMLAIIQALEDWHHYLEGLPEPGQLKTCPNDKRRTNTQADPLSRIPTFQVTDVEDNQRQVVLRPERFMRIAITRMKGGELEERIRKGVEKEAEVLQAVEELKKKGPRRLINGLLEWEEDNGLVYYKGKLYIPADKGLCTDVLKQCHDAPTAGHLGEHGTLEQVNRYYWWPGMGGFVRKYVQGCERLGVDLITGLPESQGYDAIITYVDLYSKQVHILPTVTTLDAKGVADIHYQEIFHLYGIPHKFVSDRGPQFAAQVTCALYKHLGIQAGLTTAYHPSANGQTEQANQEIEQFLRLFVSKRQDDWADWLPTAEFVLNSQVHTAHDKSPFEVVYRYRPDFIIPAGQHTNKFPALEARLDDLKKIQEEAEAAL